MIRFVNKDGVGMSTEILDAETGADISKMLCVAYGIQITLGQDCTRAQCELMVFGADVTAKAEWLTKHPITGDMTPLAAVEFRDGTRVEFADDGTPAIKARAA